jgi:cellulose synthase operon protein C
MSDLHDRVHAFADGELSPDEAASFREHLAGCASCQSELEDILQLQALGHAERSAQLAAAGVTPLPLQRRRRVFAVASTLVAAAAALAVFVRVQGQGELLAIGDVRHLEARSSYAAADRYRRYDVDRASIVQHDRPSLKVMAKLEEKGDWRGLAAAYLLAGDREQAAAALEKAGHSPEVDNERAVLALEKGDFESAIVLCDSALRQRPSMTQALWNRAIAERELGLTNQAAHSFGEVAAKSEAGWADEARQRQAALQKQADADKAAYDALNTAGDKMIAGGPVLSSEMARLSSGDARFFLAEAVRTATTRERVLSLLPLAQEIDRIDHNDYLERYVRETAQADFTVRAPLAAAYLPLEQGKTPDDTKAQEALIERFRKAGQKDLVVAGLRARNLAMVHVDEFRRLTHELGDPSFIGIAEYYAAAAQLARNDVAGAVQTLLANLAECDRGGGLEERCARNERTLVPALVEMHRVAEARQHALAGWARARRIGNRDVQFDLLVGLTEIHLLANRFALVRAYSSELGLRKPEDKEVQRYVHETRAAADVYNLQPALAHDELAAIAKAGGSLDGNGLWALADLAHLGITPAERQLGLGSIDKLRHLPEIVDSNRAMLDFLEGRLVVTTEKERGNKLLRAAIAAGDRIGRDDADAQKARAFGYSTLIAESASASNWPEAIRLLAEDARLPAPERCTLGVATDNERNISVAIGPDGIPRGSMTSRAAAQLDAAHFVPAEQVAALSACPIVAVVARPPLYGSTDLLPQTIAWSYRVGHATSDKPVAGKRLVISDVEPPANLGLARLASWRSQETSSVELKGAAATPSRVLGELVGASEIVFNAHGIVDTGQSDATMLALSPDAGGRWELGVAELRGAHLKGAPLVVLAACNGGELIVPSPHAPNSLPVAFLDAGARAVLASSEAISDADAGSFFDGIRRRAADGAALPVALRDEKTAWEAKGASWTQRVMLFE